MLVIDGGREELVWNHVIYSKNDSGQRKDRWRYSCCLKTMLIWSNEDWDSHLDFNLQSYIFVIYIDPIRDIWDYVMIW